METEKKFLTVLFVTLSIALVTGICEGTNWHCYYTNCLYVFVPEVLNSETVTSAKIEYTILKRKERFGAYTNSLPHKKYVDELSNTQKGFSGYFYTGAEQHRLWEPFEVGVSVKKIITFKGGTKILPEKIYYFSGKNIKSCGPADMSKNNSDRKRAAGQMLNQEVKQHQAKDIGTNDVLFVSKWGYVS